MNHKRLHLSKRFALAMLICLSGTATVSVPASAQEADSREQARQLFRAGEQAYNNADYANAARLFEAAYDALPSPDIAFSLAQAARLQFFETRDPQALIKAIERYRQYLDERPEGDRRRIAVLHLAELEPMRAVLGAENPGEASDDTAELPRIAEVMITSPIDGARGVVGQIEGPLPLRAELNPGRYEVSVFADGYFDGQKTVEAVAGRFFMVEVPLEPKPALVTIETERDAIIYVDGRPVGVAPMQNPIEVPAGGHTISVTQRGRKPWGRSLEAKRGQQITLSADLRRSRQRTLAYAFGISAVTLFAATAVTGLYTADLTSQAQDLDRQFDEQGLTRLELRDYLDLRQERNIFAGVSYILFGVGVATAGTGLFLYFFDMPQPQIFATQPAIITSPQTTLTPLWQPGAWGLSLSHRF